MEEHRHPCNPELCPEHSAHEQALAIGTKRFEGIDAKLDTLITWKAEMRGMWLLTVALVGILGSMVGMVSGGVAVYYTVHKINHPQVTQR